MVQFLNNQNSGFAQWNANRNAENNNKKFQLKSFFMWTGVFVALLWIFGGFNKTNVDNTNIKFLDDIDISAVPVDEFNSEKISARVQGLRISNIKLNDFSDNASAVTLLDCAECYAEIGFQMTGTTGPMANTVWTRDGAAYVWRAIDGVSYRREFSIDGNIVTITDTINNVTHHDVSVAPFVRMARDVKNKNTGVDTGAIAYINSDIENIDWIDLDKKSYMYSTVNGFLGFADQYWETIAQVNASDQTMRIRKNADIYVADINVAPVVLPAGQSRSFTTQMFAGPRDQNVLNAASGKIIGINKTMDYGTFAFLTRPMLWSLNSLNAIVGNYGIAIILFTIMLRLLIWPLTRKSFTSMIAMQKMQPEMARIQKLYANDKARMQMELLRLYQTHKTSPMSGCLPMLIQIPIFFALYKALLVSVQMRSAQFLWISDLAVMDPYFILPILMGGTMWLQQKMQNTTRTTSNGNDMAVATQRAMRWMPIIFTVMFAFFPAGLVLYWTVSNLCGIAQIYILQKRAK